MPSAAALSSGAPDLQRAMASLQEERFSEVLDHLGNLPPQYAEDPDVLLLKAVTLAQSGASTRARDTCAALLARDALHAGAHYVLALCEEGCAGELDDALGHYQGAAYLAPGFAMARLQSGRLLRRLGQQALARAELALAAQLPARRRPRHACCCSVVAFPRSALLALCHAELQAVGGTP